MIAAMQRHVRPVRCVSRGRTAGCISGAGCRRGVSSRALLDRALAAGVAFVPGHAFYPDPAGESELRLCFSSVMPATIDDAIRRLAGCLPGRASAATASDRVGIRFRGLLFYA